MHNLPAICSTGSKLFKVVIRVYASIIEIIFKKTTLECSVVGKKKKKTSLEILWWPGDWDPTLPLQGAQVPSHVARPKKKKDFLHPVLPKYIFAFENIFIQY